MDALWSEEKIFIPKVDESRARPTEDLHIGHSVCQANAQISMFRRQQWTDVS